MHNPWECLETPSPTSLDALEGLNWNDLQALWLVRNTSMRAVMTPQGAFVSLVMRRGRCLIAGVEVAQSSELRAQIVEGVLMRTTSSFVGRLNNGESGPLLKSSSYPSPIATLRSINCSAKHTYHKIGRGRIKHTLFPRRRSHRRIQELGSNPRAIFCVRDAHVPGSHMLKIFGATRTAALE